MLSVVLTGAALIREREHGTVEHLLVMPVTPTEIMISKIWSMGVVVLVVAMLSLMVVVRGVLAVPTHGSIPLFAFATALQLYATTAMGIALATLAESMPQFALLLILVLLPIQVLSGATTPRESMPEIIQTIMLGAPRRTLNAFLHLRRRVRHLPLLREVHGLALRLEQMRLNAARMHRFAELHPHERTGGVSADVTVMLL